MLVYSPKDLYTQHCDALCEGFEILEKGVGRWVRGKVRRVIERGVKEEGGGREGVLGEGEEGGGDRGGREGVEKGEGEKGVQGGEIKQDSNSPNSSSPPPNLPSSPLYFMATPLQLAREYREYCEVHVGGGGGEVDVNSALSTTGDAELGWLIRYFVKRESGCRVECSGLDRNIWPQKIAFVGKV